MTHLDCHDFETMVASVSAAIGRTPEDLEAAIRHYDYERERNLGEPLSTYMPRDVLSSLGVEIELVTFDGTYWFHGTRTLDPDRFQGEGLLPLPQVIDFLWEALYELSRGDIERDNWDAFRRSIEGGGGGHYADLYRLKMGSPTDHGPLGELVRHVLLNPSASSSHDYLGTPEIVQDIAIEAKDAFGVDLEPRFAESASPCLVKFRTAKFSKGALETALVYGSSVATEGRVGRGACFAFSGAGVPIRPEDILRVESL